MTDTSKVNDDEIDLAELFASLSSEWRTILLSASAFAVISFIYASLIISPMYEAKSVFAFEKAQTGGLSGLGGAAALLGINAGSTGNDKLVFDRVASRDFIISLAAENGLYDDPYFNPTRSEGGLSWIKSFIGSSTESKIDQSIVDASLVSKFTESVKVSLTKNSSIETIVNHSDPVVAALVANAVVNKILEDTLQDQINKSLREVDYFGEQLSKVQLEMDDAVMRLQEFSINRNALSIEELVKRSTQLVKLRESRDTTQRMLNAVKQLASVTNSIDEKQKIIKKFPEILSSEFRLQAQLLNSDPETQDLNADRLNEIVKILGERIKDIEAAIFATEANAKISADEASDLLTLQREVKVQEATYQVFVEQYKSRSLLSGYQEANGTILQVAVPATGPSSPNKKLILTLGIVLGTFFGFGIAFIKNIRNAKLYTIRSINDVTQARKVISLGKQDFALEIASDANLNNKYTLIWPICHNATASMNISFNHVLKAWSDAGFRTGYVYAGIREKNSSLNIMIAEEIRIDNFSSHMVRGDLIAAVEKAADNFDRVLIICDYGKTPVGAISVMKQLPASLVVIAKLGETLKVDAEKVRTVAQPDLLLLG